MDTCGRPTDWPKLPCGLAPGHPGRCYPQSPCNTGRSHCEGVQRICDTHAAVWYPGRWVCNFLWLAPESDYRR